MTGRGRLLRAGYILLVGVFMIVFWAGLALTGGIPELDTAPVEIGYHLVAELLTASALVAAGLGILRGYEWGSRLYPVALGLLLYTVINSAGYYAALGNVPMVGMFSVLTVATLFLLVDYVRGSDVGPERAGGRPESSSGRLAD
ncbi:MAG: hypothetical protein V5A21_03050 [Halapricum sp.]